MARPLTFSVKTVVWISSHEGEAILAVLPDMVPLIERKTGTVQQYMQVLRALRCSQDVWF